MPNILITGDNRGLGLGLVTAYLAQPNNTVIAAVRDPTDARSKALSTLPLGPTLLFQAVLPLLLAAKEQPPKFVTMGSTASTIQNMQNVPVPNAAYGPSKAALHWISRKIHFENETIVAFPTHPGWVQTEMGNAGAVAFGMEKAALELEPSIQGMLKVIAAATRENTSGKFMTYDRTESLW